LRLHKIKMTTAPRRFADAKAAVAAISELYERNTGYLRDAFVEFAKGQTPDKRLRAYYPYVSLASGRPPEMRLT